MIVCIDIDDDKQCVFDGRGVQCRRLIVIFIMPSQMFAKEGMEKKERGAYAMKRGRGRSSPDSLTF